MKHLYLKLRWGVILFLLIGTFVGCADNTDDLDNNILSHTVTSDSTDLNHTGTLQATDFPAEFNMDDLTAGGVKYGDNPGRVEEVFGIPDTENAYQEGATGYDIVEYYYSDGNVFEFIKKDSTEEFKLRSVNIITIDAAAARGLRVGSSMDDVIKAFRYDGAVGTSSNRGGDAEVSDRTDETGGSNDANETNENHELIHSILYAAEIREYEYQTLIIPPRGIISEDSAQEGSMQIHYNVPVNPYKNEEEIIGYVYQVHGSIRFVIADGEVTEYSWFVGAMAE